MTSGTCRSGRAFTSTGHAEVGSSGGELPNFFSPAQNAVAIGMGLVWGSSRAAPATARPRSGGVSAAPRATTQRPSREEQFEPPMRCPVPQRRFIFKDIEQSNPLMPILAQEETGKHRLSLQSSASMASCLKHTSVRYRSMYQDYIPLPVCGRFGIDAPMRHTRLQLAPIPYSRLPSFVFCPFPPSHVPFSQIRADHMCGVIAWRDPERLFDIEIPDICDDRVGNCRGR